MPTFHFLPDPEANPEAGDTVLNNDIDTHTHTYAHDALRSLLHASSEASHPLHTPHSTLQSVEPGAHRLPPTTLHPSTHPAPPTPPPPRTHARSGIVRVGSPKQLSPPAPRRLHVAPAGASSGLPCARTVAFGGLGASRDSTNSGDVRSVWASSTQRCAACARLKHRPCKRRGVVGASGRFWQRCT